MTIEKNTPALISEIEGGSSLKRSQQSVQKRPEQI
jgi:hypothetical protein